MFMPPGNNSRYVPLKSQAWGLNFTLDNAAVATGNPTIWGITAAGQNPAAAIDQSVHPQWQRNAAPVTMIPVPVVTMNNGNVANNAATITINGSGFDTTLPGNNTVTFNLGATGTVTAVNPAGTQLTVTFNAQPMNGNLTAVVALTNQNINSGAPVQVATIVAP
jgi:hypothetical protein